MIRAAAPQEVVWISKAMGYTPTADCKGIVYASEEELYAAVLYDHWTPNSVNCHIWAAPNRGVHLFNPIFHSEIFKYPFCQCDKGLAIVITPGDNIPSLKMSDALGFKEKYRIQDGWDVGVDLVVKECRRDEWLVKLKRVA